MSSALFIFPFCVFAISNYVFLSCEVFFFPNWDSCSYFFCFFPPINLYVLVKCFKNLLWWRLQFSDSSYHLTQNFLYFAPSLLLEEFLSTCFVTQAIIDELLQLFLSEKVFISPSHQNAITLLWRTLGWQFLSFSFWECHSILSWLIEFLLRYLLMA